MPIYDYACSACGHVTEVIHGINDPGPRFCPSCGAEGTMRKALSPPAIVFKGSGWAKLDRRSAGGSRSSGSKAAPAKSPGADSDRTGSARESSPPTGGGSSSSGAGAPSEGGSSPAGGSGSKGGSAPGGAARED